MAGGRLLVNQNIRKGRVMSETKPVKVVWGGIVEICEFDDADWTAFSGAEKFADDCNPVICHPCDYDFLVVVAGGQGIEVIVGYSDEDQSSFILPFQLPTQNIGVLFIVALVEHAFPCIESENVEETWRVLKLYGFVSRKVVGN